MNSIKTAGENSEVKFDRAKSASESYFSGRRTKSCNSWEEKTNSIVCYSPIQKCRKSEKINFQVVIVTVYIKFLTIHCDKHSHIDIKYKSKLTIN